MDNGLYRVSVGKDGFIVEFMPLKDVPVGYTNLGRWPNFRKAAQVGRQFMLDHGMIG
jgi:hypothetical protein